MTLLTEAVIVWVHMLRTVLLEQKGRKTLVWGLRLMAKVLVCFFRMVSALGLSAR